MERRFTIIPGLEVTREMYLRARNGLRDVAPDLPTLTWEEFTNADNWTLVPAPDGFGYKAEYMVVRTRERTIKFNRWMGPDLRDGEQSRPHNHPWVQFEAYIWSGGYTEDRYTFRAGKLFQLLNRLRRLVGLGPVRPAKKTVQHREGDKNLVPKATYHEVTAVLPDTLTMMVCAEGIKDDWGYLDPTTGEVRHNSADEDLTFDERLRALNPRLQQQ